MYCCSVMLVIDYIIFSKIRQLFFHHFLFSLNLPRFSPCYGTILWPRNECWLRRYAENLWTAIRYSKKNDHYVVCSADCTILSNLLDRHPNNFHMALKEFSDSRWPDAQAICDLAMYNYTEVSLKPNL